MQLQVISPEGQDVAFTVPEGAEPGSTMSIQYAAPTDFLMLRCVHLAGKGLGGEGMQQAMSEVKSFIDKWKL